MNKNSEYCICYSHQSLQSLEAYFIVFSVQQTTPQNIKPYETKQAYSGSVAWLIL